MRFVTVSSPVSGCWDWSVRDQNILMNADSVKTVFKLLTRCLAGVWVTSLCSIACAGETNKPALMSCCTTAGSDALPHWSIELASGITFSNIRDNTLDSYTLVPTELMLSRTFDHVFLKHFLGGILQGQAELSAGGYYTVVTKGVEHYIAGYHAGTRYSFTRPGRKLAPFLGWNVGMGWADAHQYLADGNLHGLGQAFNFNFEVLGGLQYSLTPRSFMRLTVVYSHYSNAGLSLPEHSNKAIDALGPMLGLGWRF